MSSFIYLYDIGDNWQHRVTVKEFSDQQLDRPVCLEGRSACPPEDCGGLPGYYEILKMLKKNHKDHFMWTTGSKSMILIGKITGLILTGAMGIRRSTESGGS
ncbi:MAG: plasmid pRiA4b ORF-3 family protein [Chitinophagaceae bacterium]|nr:plasmid pRiA4b ORF-3 family protein [Chitinophagaceae bacterium]